jgi:hypothetical protein
VRASAIETQRRQRVDLAVNFGDASFQRIEEIEGGDVAAAQTIDDGASRCLQKLSIWCLRMPLLFLHGPRSYLGW